MDALFCTTKNKLVALPWKVTMAVLLVSYGCADKLCNQGLWRAIL